jgi:CBS domain-containing protein
MIPVKELTTLTAEEPAFEALRKMATAGVSGLPVLDDVEGTLVGMLYERDVARWVELQAPVARTGRGDRPRHA